MDPLDPLLMFVPSGPHDLTAPIDITSLREAIAQDAQVAAHPLDPYTAASAFFPIPQASAGPPSASGPTLVVPTVSVPALRANTTIAETAPSTAEPDTATGGEGKPPADSRRRHRGNSSSDKSSRLPTTVGVSALLAAFFAATLVVLASGHSSAPLAPTALPTRSATHSSTQHVTHLAPSHKASASAAPSHSPAASPHSSGSASASSAPNRPNTSNPGTVTNFATITWTNDDEPLVRDIQSRLASLHYLTPIQNGTLYAVTRRTTNDVPWTAVPDRLGYYQNATDSAIRAFEFDYLQHRQGQLPGSGCSSQTYQALVNATS
jgi:hypothetical protein